MSTKIYNSFRVKPDADVWAVLRDIYDRAEKNVAKKLRAFYLEQMDQLDPESEGYRVAREKEPDRSEASLRLSLVHDTLRRKFKESATSMERSEYDLDVELALTQHRTGYYLRAFCDNVSCLGGSLDFLKKHPDLEDFHYQNQTDRPRGVSEASWEERKCIWEEMTDKAGFFRYQLVMEVCGWDRFWRLDPWLEIARAIQLNPPTFPPREEILTRCLRGLSGIEAITAEPGLIIVKTAASAITIEKSGKRAQRGQWLTRMDGKLKRHTTLERAIDLVYLAHVSPAWRETIEHYQKEYKRERKRKKVTRKRV